MSTASLASARKRRAPISANTPSTPVVSQRTTPATGINPSNMPNPATGLTLPQVISLVDQRLVVLENHMKDNLRRRDEEHIVCSMDDVVANEIPSEILDEFSNRFETLAQEVENLKNIVLSLQSYTMEVNKTLLNERIRILGSDDSVLNASN